MNLRKAITQQRLQLPIEQQLSCASQIFQTLAKLQTYQQAKCIGLYSHANAEVHTDLIMKDCLNQQKYCYLPVITDYSNFQMGFYQFNTPDELIENKFHILEPDTKKNQVITPVKLDVIIMPLVAFDTNCQRIGTGSGFYDRYLALEKKPYLIGLAYDFQHISTITTNSWDVPLDQIITEKKVYTR